MFLFSCAVFFVRDGKISRTRTKNNYFPIELYFYLLVFHSLSFFITNGMEMLSVKS